MAKEIKNESFLDSLKELQNCIDEGQVEAASNLCLSLLKTLSDTNDTEDPENDELEQLLYETYVKCLLQLQDYQKAFDFVEKGKIKSNEIRRSLQPLQAYALYRLERYEQSKVLAKKETKGDDSHALKHVIAQSLYHQAETLEATKIYKELLSELSGIPDDEQTMQTKEQQMETLTNLLAVMVANATPYAKNDDHEDIVDMVQSLIQSSSPMEPSYPYDLAFNFATWQLATNGGNQWNKLLGQARKGCESVLSDEGAPEEDIVKEQGPIIFNTAWSRHYWGEPAEKSAYADGPSAKGDTPATAVIRSVNSAMASNMKVDETLKILSEAPRANLTALQKRLWWYNKAVYQLRANKLDDCRQTCDALLETMKPMSQTKKKKKIQSGQFFNYYPTLSEIDLAWWESRLDVLRAFCFKAENKLDQAVDLLNGRLAKVSALPVSTVRDHTVAYLQIQASVTKDQSQSNQVCQLLLQGLPESMQEKKAVIASLGSLYHQQGKTEEAKVLMQKSGDELALADFAMSQENYEEAIALYEKTNSSDISVKTRLVQALTYTDVKRAQMLWAEILPDLDVGDDDGDATGVLNGEELEMKEMPRLKISKARKAVVMSVDEEQEGKTKRSHEAILRRRARKREAYLTKLQEQGRYRPDRPAKADPERWLPKHERASNRRRRGGPGKASQGGVSEKDASKLDVLARASARANGTDLSNGPSTAHIQVASESGIRKGGKGGRRR